jgi:pentatricopeptide repeat domain-containing protein 1
MQLFNTMERKFGVRPDSSSYRNIVIVCNQAQHEKSRRKRAAPTNAGRSEDSEFEWWECALSLLRRFNEEGFRPDPSILSSAISACESASQWQRALGILQSTMASDGISALNLYCFNAAISACEKGGAWVEALEIYERMKGVGGILRPNFVTLNSLLVALDKAGQKELAQNIYEEGEIMGVVQPWITTLDFSGNSIRAMVRRLLRQSMLKAKLASNQLRVVECKGYAQVICSYG